MQRIILAIIGLSVLAIGLNCGGGAAAPGSGNDSPTEAYKRLYAAVKSKDTEAIKRELTDKSIDLAKMASAKTGIPVTHIQIPLSGEAAKRSAAALLFPLWDRQLAAVCSVVAPDFFYQPTASQ